ncbi:MAG: TrmH family RNA methyltransferase [Bacillota bacterium]
MESKDRAQYFASKYPGKITFAGAKHSRIKQVEHLLNNTKPNPRGLAVIEGLWALGLALKNRLSVDCFIFCPELIRTPEGEAMVDAYVRQGGDCCLVSARVFGSISERERGDGLLAVVEMPRVELDDIPLSDNSLVVILDSLEIPGNIGTIIRAADGAGVAGVLIVNRKARLNHPKLVRSSQGAAFSVPIVECQPDQAFVWLDKNGFTVFLTDTKAELDYFQASFRGRTALVAGSERYGISQAWYSLPHIKIRIPMYGDCDSLNVGVATTIMLYEASLQLKGRIIRR